MARQHCDQGARPCGDAASLRRRLVGICALVGRIAHEAPGLTIRRYVLSLVPIAIAYHLAHYLSYLLIQGQAIWPLLTDPLNLGWDLFGTRGYEIDIGIVDMRFIWIFAVDRHRCRSCRRHGPGAC